MSKTAPTVTEAPAPQNVTLTVVELEAMMTRVLAAAQGGAQIVTDGNALPNPAIARLQAADVAAHDNAKRYVSYEIKDVAMDHLDPQNHEFVPATCSLKITDSGRGAGFRIVGLDGFRCETLEQDTFREASPDAGAFSDAERAGPAVIERLQASIRMKARHALYIRGWQAALRAWIGKPLRATVQRGAFSHPSLAAILESASDAPGFSGSIAPVTGASPIAIPDDAGPTRTTASVNLRIGPAPVEQVLAADDSTPLAPPTGMGSEDIRAQDRKGTMGASAFGRGVD